MLTALVVTLLVEMVYVLLSLHEMRATLALAAGIAKRFETTAKT